MSNRFWTEEEDDMLRAAWARWLARNDGRKGEFDVVFGPTINRGPGSVGARRRVLNLQSDPLKIAKDAQPVDDGYTARRRADASGGDRDYLAALGRLTRKTPPPAEVDRPEGAFRQLPPPTLTGQAFS